jgi:hypothetical protein
LLGSISTIGDLDVADRFDSSLLFFYREFFQGIANHIRDTMRPVALFSNFSLRLHTYIVAHIANQRLLDN